MNICPNCNSTNTESLLVDRTIHLPNVLRKFKLCIGYKCLNCNYQFTSGAKAVNNKSMIKQTRDSFVQAIKDLKDPKTLRHEVQYNVKSNKDNDSSQR